ncbi:EpsG family protein [Turicibacter sanguinis]|uniref:EpsG family protein n=1 Tax=Turicibacter sanguinis TaxID=154288 RepID=UPI00232A8BBC|nr:EpsG family protein [Turicibacter sanguinis]MDB8542314.1 EpsG family protein [Turicibacter sanguinis]
MVYILLFCLSIFGFILGSKYQRYEKWIFVSILLIFSILGAIRYGSGTDYFAYKYHYDILSPNIMNAIFNVSGTDSSHMDIGFRAIISLCKSIGITYELFIAILSIVTTGLVGYVIYKNSKLKILSWVLFLGNYYLVYMNSALRQGLAMCLFIFAFYEFYKNKKYFLYVIFILIGTTIHSSCIVGLVVFGIDLLFKYNLDNRRNNILILGFACLFTIINIPNLILTFSKLELFYTLGNINWIPLLVRLCYLIFIYIFMRLDLNDENNSFKKKEIYIFFIGIIIYIALSRFSIASRVTDYFMFLEIILLPNLIQSSEKCYQNTFSLYNKKINLLIHKKNWVFLYTLLVSLLFLKDLIACTYQEQYHMHKPWDYTYVTIFNKQELYSLRNMESNFPR